MMSIPLNGVIQPSFNSLHSSQLATWSNVLKVAFHSQIQSTFSGTLLAWDFTYSIILINVLNLDFQLAGQLTNRNTRNTSESACCEMDQTFHSWKPTKIGTNLVQEASLLKIHTITGHTQKSLVLAQFLGVKLPVQDSSLFWCFFTNECMCLWKRHVWSIAE